MKLLTCAGVFGEEGDAGIRTAAKIARYTGSELTVIYVRQKIPDRFHKYLDSKIGEAGETLRERIESAPGVEEAVFERVDKILAEHGIKGKKVHRVGNPVEEILKEAHRGYHMIILGSRGVRGATRLLFGSISYSIAEYAKLPVLVVKKDSELRKILACTDGSAHAEEAEFCAGALAKSLGASVTLLSVAHEDALKSVAESAAAKGAEMIKREFGIDAESKVAVGKARHEIIYEAKNYDLVVLGSRGLSKLKRIIIGHVSLKVLDDAPTNVLIVRNCVLYRKRRAA